MSPNDLVRLIGEGYSKRAWHGPNLRTSLHGVSVAEALWRPAPGRPCIWELVLHCAYWKHRVLARTSGVREKFPRSPVNFPRLPSRPDEAAWRTDLALLDDVHRRLLALVASLDEATLAAAPPGQRLSREAHLVGIAFHDVYHAGQIRALRRLHEGAAAPRRAGIGKRSRRGSRRARPAG